MEALKISGLKTIKTLRQVHSSRVVVIKDSETSFEGVLEGDALISSVKACGVGVYTADCVPILLVDRSLRAVGAVHAGWRGTLEKIVPSIIKLFGSEFGVTPSELVAAIGPSIGGCCYEVGEDVAQKFIDFLGDVNGCIFPVRGYKYLLDLKEVNRITLFRCGVESVEVLPHCTMCRSDLYSLRREGRGVRSQLSFIGLL
ncbi:MAG: peptidoglycan editing factor PgeF [Candidatus Caldarchaeum sp.]